MKEDEAGKKCNEDGSDGLGKCDACSNFRDRPNSAIALSRVRRVIVRRPRALLQSSILNVGICISVAPFDLQVGRRQLQRSSRRSNSSTSWCGRCRLRAASAFICDACCSKLPRPRTLGE
jgi:hypothetical protein